MQKILVTGASGFLGKNLISKILKNKNFVIYALTHSKNYEFKDKKNLLLIDCDITNSKKLKKKLNLNFDYVVNFAGNINHKNKKETYDAHFKGLKNIINSINLDKLKLFIQIGSSLEYGNAKSPHFESQACNPMSHYGKSKFLATKLWEQGIETRPLFKPVNLMQPYKKFSKTKLISSEKIFGCGINLPSFPSLKDEQIDLIINTINNTPGNQLIKKLKIKKKFNIVI